MNNFHRFQSFRQFSILFSQIWLKKRQTSLYSRFCREIWTNFKLQIRRKMQNSTQKMKKSETQYSFAKKNWRFLTKKLRLENRFGIHFSPMDSKTVQRDSIPKRCKGVHCVDLGESFPTSISLQNLASIQPRTSLVKFARSPRTDPPGTWKENSDTT